jgi:hypothetical protein
MELWQFLFINTMLFILGWALGAYVIFPIINRFWL